MAEATCGSDHTYLRDPAAIYRESFAAIRREVDLSRFPTALQSLVIRLVHAAGDASIAGDLRWSENAAETGRAALSRGAPILADAEMVAYGVIRSRLQKNNAVFCTINEPGVPELAQYLGTTRSAAAVEFWVDQLEGAVVAIGNAPTALFHLLELIKDKSVKPALILGFPVGFVGAADSKLELAENTLGLDYITLFGRRGGSAMAAAAVNALAGPAEEGLLG